MSTTERGRLAEQLAANYLIQRGYKIVDQNWHNRFAELDIIASLAGTIHIVEVKYRAGTAYGGAFEYITRDKAQRLKDAATVWAAQNHHTGPIQIDAIAVTGQLTRPIIDFLENAISD